MFWERSDTALSGDQLKSLRVTQVDPEDALSPISQLDGFSVAPMRVDGTFNRLYRFDDGYRRKVARFSVHPSPSTAALHLESWAADEAISRGVSTPKVVHVDTSRAHCPYPFQLIEWSDTQPLRGSDDETTRRVLGRLARELVKLHGGAAPSDRFGRVGLGLLPEWDLFWTYNIGEHTRYCIGHRLLTSDQAAEVEVRCLESFDCAAPSLLHGDLSYDNIRVKDGQFAALIDWEDAVLGDSIFELAGLATFHPETRHQTFLDAYYGGPQRPDGFERRFWTYYLRISLAKAVHRHRFGYESPARAEGVLHPDDRIPLALDKLNKLT